MMSTIKFSLQLELVFAGILFLILFRGNLSCYIDPDDETRAAVQKKVNAQQDLELAKIEQQTANVNAEKEKEVAITKANQEKETAQINAEAKLIEAQAQADANRLISQSLTPELIQQQMYEKWNGQLPTVQSGSDTPIIVDTTN